MAGSSTTSTWTVARSALVIQETGTSIVGGDGRGIGHLLPRSAVPQVATVSGYSYLGCYTDYTTRILSATETDFIQFNNAAMCCSWCANVDATLSLCGVEFGWQCFCDSGFKDSAAQNLASPSDCAEMCYGDNDLACGSAARINVYSATIDVTEQTAVSATLTAANVPDYSYLGCFSDSTGRLLQATATTASLLMNAEYCCAWCINVNNGNVFCGVENGNECYCDSSTSIALPASTSQCSRPCSGNGGQRCGGSYRINIYEATGVHTGSSSASFPTAITTTSTPTPTMTQSPSPNHGGLHGGAIAGVVVGVLAGIALVSGLSYYVWTVRRRRSQQRRGLSGLQPIEVSGETRHGYGGPYEMDPSVALAHAAGPTKVQQIHELQADH